MPPSAPAEVRRYGAILSGGHEHSVNHNHIQGIQMNKSELIEAVANSTGLARNEAASATDAVLDSIVDALVGGDQVNISGFGTFSVRDRAARSGRNPQTGETIQIKASKSPGFKAGKAFKDAVN
jgi:DNA-binding protein HU-beta